MTNTRGTLTIRLVHGALPHLTEPAPVPHEQIKVVIIIVVQKEVTACGQEVDMWTKCAGIKLVEMGRDMTTKSNQVRRDN